MVEAMFLAAVGKAVTTMRCRILSVGVVIVASSGSTSTSSVSTTNCLYCRADIPALNARARAIARSLFRNATAQYASVSVKNSQFSSAISINGVIARVYGVPV